MQSFRNTTSDDAGSLQIKTASAPLPVAGSLGITRGMAAKFIHDKYPQEYMWINSSAKKNLEDYSAFESIMIGMTVNSVKAITFTGVDSAVSRKISPFSAVDNNAVSGVTVRMAPKFNEIPTLVAQRGIDFVKPPATALAEIKNSSGTFVVPVFQGFPNLNYADSEQEMCKEVTGIKKMVQHLAIFTEVSAGKIVPRIKDIDEPIKEHNLGIFSDGYERFLPTICDEITAICRKQNVVLKKSVNGKNYADMLYKLYDNAAAEKTESDFNDLVGAYDAMIRKTAPNGAPRTIVRAGKRVQIVPGLQITKPDVYVDGQLTVGRSVDYVSVPFTGITLPRNYHTDSADSTVPEKILKQARSFGGTDNKEINVGQRDYMFPMWIGAEAGDVVRLANNLAMSPNEKYVFHGNKADLVKFCRALTYLDECDKLEGDIDEFRNYDISVLNSSVKNNASFIANGTNSVYAKNPRITVRACLQLPTSTDHVQFYYEDQNKANKSTEVFRATKLLLQQLDENPRFIARFHASTLTMQALYEFNKGREHPILAYSGVELHNLNVWLFKGVEMENAVCETRFNVTMHDKLAAYYTTSIYVNIYRMFNSFWNLPYTAFLTKMGITQPYCDFSAPIGFTTVAAMIDKDSVDISLLDLYALNVRSSIHDQIASGKRNHFDREGNNGTETTEKEIEALEANETDDYDELQGVELTTNRLEKKK